MRCRVHDLLLAVLFVAIVIAPGLVQLGAEWRRGEHAQVWDVFQQPPTPAHLHTFEQRLEDRSLTIETLRPWMQYAQFVWLDNAGAKALVGRDGWYFYRPGVEYATQRAKSGQAGDDPLPAICNFRDQLAARGIHLIVMPAPNKESVYPDKLTRRAAGRQGIVVDRTRDLLRRLRQANIDVIDLFAFFEQVRRQESKGESGPLYLRQDSHWSPRGMQLAAQLVADRVQCRVGTLHHNADYQLRDVPLERLGDVLQMLRVPQIERRIEPESILCHQVIADLDRQPYHDDSDSEVLVLGDSFLRIYQQDEPGAAGFIAHLACELHQPLASIVNDGGASTLVRQQLFQRPELLTNKKVVVWEFVERDIGGGMEGWQIVPLPKLSQNTVDRGSSQPDPIGDRSFGRGK